MTEFLGWAATASILIWCGLITLRGGFWRADVFLDVDPAGTVEWPDVIAVVPARNEAETIGPVVRSLVSSSYPGTFSVVVVDDHSEDGTGDIARKAAAAGNRSLSVVTAPELRPGWSGKLAAVAAGLAEAQERQPSARYVLLTDADILHPPDLLARLVAKAETQSLALVSLMALLDCRGFWGKLLVPPFVFFFQKLYPFPLVNDPAAGTAGAAGGCMLVRRDALDAIGGIRAIRGALIDDCALAAAIKHGPPRRAIWLGLSRSLTSLRDNRSIASIWSMVARTAFTQLQHSAVLLVLCLVGMAAVYLAGPAAAIVGVVEGAPFPALAGGAAWALSAFAFRPTVQLYRLSGLWAATLPLAALLYSLMTVSSAVAHWRGRGGRWKGRDYKGLASRAK